MLLIYSHKGYLVPIIIFLNLVAAEVISEMIMQDENFYQESLYPRALSVLISALFLHRLDRFLESKNESVKDNRTGQEVILNQKNHSFLFIPIRYWVIFCVVAFLATYLWEALNI